MTDPSPPKPADAKPIKKSVTQSEASAHNGAPVGPRRARPRPLRLAPQSVVDAPQTLKIACARGPARITADRGRAAAPGGPALIDLSGLNRVRDFDATAGVLTAEAGLSLVEAARLCLPRAFAPPIPLGGLDMSLGAAIATNAPTPSLHRPTRFGDSVRELALATSQGEVRVCSRTHERGLFEATLGGDGRTGAILWARVELTPVRSAAYDVVVRSFADLASFLAAWSNLEGPGYARAHLPIKPDAPFAIEWARPRADRDLAPSPGGQERLRPVQGRLRRHVAALFNDGAGGPATLTLSAPPTRASATIEAVLAAIGRAPAPPRHVRAATDRRLGDAGAPEARFVIQIWPAEDAVASAALVGALEAAAEALDLDTETVGPWAPRRHRAGAHDAPELDGPQTSARARRPTPGAAEGLSETEAESDARAEAGQDVEPEVGRDARDATSSETETGAESGAETGAESGTSAQADAVSDVPGESGDQTETPRTLADVVRQAPAPTSAHAAPSDAEAPEPTQTTRPAPQKASNAPSTAGRRTVSRAATPAATEKKAKPKASKSTGDPKPEDDPTSA